MGLLVENVIASLEVISSKKVQCQILGNMNSFQLTFLIHYIFEIGLCPAISIDNTAGAMLYLSEQAIDSTQIFTAKSTEMNILFKTATMKEDDDLLELPIPEQFVTKMTKQGTLVTEAVQHI